MGLIATTAKKMGWITNYSSPGQLFKNWSGCLVSTGKQNVDISVGDMGVGSVQALVDKLDAMFPDSQNDAISRWVASEIPSIIMAVRSVLYQTGGVFGGLLGAGSDLDIAMVRSKDIGTTLMNALATGSSYVYGGGSAAYTYLYTFAANTSVNIVPNQQMSQYAATVYLGWKTDIEVTKISNWTPTIDGQASGPQPAFVTRRLVGQEMTEGIVKFQYPILIQPQHTLTLALKPTIAGDDRPELVAFIIARISDLITYL